MRGDASPLRRPAPLSRKQRRYLRAFDSYLKADNGPDERRALRLMHALFLKFRR